MPGICIASASESLLNDLGVGQLPRGEHTHGELRFKPMLAGHKQHAKGSAGSGAGHSIMFGPGSL